jgi:hypothetical protein
MPMFLMIVQGNIFKRSRNWGRAQPTRPQITRPDGLAICSEGVAVTGRVVLLVPLGVWVDGKRWSRPSTPSNKRTSRGASPTIPRHSSQLGVASTGRPSMAAVKHREACLCVQNFLAPTPQVLWTDEGADSPAHHPGRCVARGVRGLWRSRGRVLGLDGVARLGFVVSAHHDTLRPGG